MRTTPCARSALIHGILSGLTVGFVYFACTSVVRRSCDFAVGGFALVSLTSWEVCRLVKARERAEIKRTVKILNTISEQTRKEGEQTGDVGSKL